VFKKAAEGKVEIVWNSTLDEVLGDAGGVTGMRVKNLARRHDARAGAQGVFVAIGHEPNTKNFRRPSRDEWRLHKGEVGQRRRRHRDQCARLFAAGDVMDHVYRQAVTSAAPAAGGVDAEKYLDNCPAVGAALAAILSF